MKTKKSLRLATETLRTLSDAETTNVVGGQMSGSYATAPLPPSAPCQWQRPAYLL